MSRGVTWMPGTRQLGMIQTQSNASFIEALSSHLRCFISISILAANCCPYRVVSQGSGYRLALRRTFYPVRNKFYGRVREAQLSQAAIDVLAIVAYQQPLTSEEVSSLRGTPSSHILTQLVRRRLLRIERPPGKQRPAHYHTTDRFLELFGLESLDDLPQAEELESR